MPNKQQPPRQRPALPDPIPARLRMRETRRGSHNGQHIFTYEAGEVYDPRTSPPMSTALAIIFLGEGWAEDADAAPLAVNRAAKVVGPSETKTPDDTAPESETSNADTPAAPTPAAAPADARETK